MAAHTTESALIMCRVNVDNTTPFNDNSAAQRIANKVFDNDIEETFEIGAVDFSLFLPISMELRYHK